MNETRTVCLYHGSDLDGICSAAIVKHRYPDAILIPLTYDNPFDVDDLLQDGDDIIMCDFVLQPFTKMIDISEKHHITWIDHHDTSMDDYDVAIREDRIKSLDGKLEIGKGACQLTWEYMFPAIPVPYTVWMLSRYDVWCHHESKSILPFQYGMLLNHQAPENTDFWTQVFEKERDSRFIHSIMNDGHTIIKYRTKLNEKICEVQAFESTLLNHKCICFNRAMCGSSVFDGIWDTDKYDFMITFYVCNEGAWNVSMYTDKKDIHVGKIAQHYGGGGHAGAAGFRCSLLPFDVTD
jgi:oligoribonuclease NrnB/cAMP/cGMP phosphodiesterase (DHH superfamily)